MLWVVGFTIAAAVVVVVAVLAIAILAAAISIRRGAERALAVGARIREHTLPLWGLEATNKVARQLAEASRSLEGHATALAGALEGANSTEVRN